MARTSRLTPAGLRSAVAAGTPSGPATVALSGGADSAVLAWAVAERPHTEALTVDHGLPASPALVAAARRIASDLGLPHRVVVVAPRSGSEDDLRRARLAALETETDGWILTGHTADDQAETVLGNVIRGAGTAGLAGIPRRRLRFVRPLLDVPRADTRRLASMLGLGFVDDPGNSDLAIRRNRIRHVTLPALARDHNPAVVDALTRLGAAAAADEELLADRAAAIPLRCDEEAVLVPAAALTGLPAAVAARVAVRAVQALRGVPGGDAASVAAILRAASGAASAGLPGGLVARREGPFVAISGRAPTLPAAMDLPAAGEVRFGPWTIVVGAGPVKVPRADGWQVRAAAAGDRLAIPGGSKAVSTVLREAGVAPRLRSRWPVVADRDTIHWVVGIRPAPADGRDVVAMTARKERG